jgi:hypothetical protein
MVVVVVDHLGDSSLLRKRPSFETFELSRCHAASGGFPEGGSGLAGIRVAESIPRPEIVEMEGIMDSLRRLLETRGTFAVPDVPVSRDTEVS